MELFKAVTRPLELWALVKFKYGGGQDHIMPKVDYGSLGSDMRRCLELLNQTSRSFAAVIQALDDDLRPAICIFYLVLRALDTVEDDMNIPADRKTEMLKEFHAHLYEEEWRFMESSEKDKAVLEEFPIIAAEFRRLKPVFQEVIADITKRMGHGMTVFLVDKVGTLEQWNEYCHYVAGLVGIGLSRLFSASGLEAAEVGRDERLANSMGLFLQKTNIIRDYLEDIVDGREFWPREGWSQFASDLSDFKSPENLDKAVACLNYLVCNALQHVPDVLTYMGRIRNQSVYNFCAIPQTMAIATLAACYNNPAVFKGVVKIRKGQAVDLMMRSTNMDNLKLIFLQYTNVISLKIPVADPSYSETTKIVTKMKSLCLENLSPGVLDSSQAGTSAVVLAGLVLTVAMGVAYYEGYLVS